MFIASAPGNRYSFKISNELIVAGDPIKVFNSILKLRILNFRTRLIFYLTISKALHIVIPKYTPRTTDGLVKWSMKKIFAELYFTIHLPFILF